MGANNALRDNQEGLEESPLEVGSNLSGSPSQDFGVAPENIKKRPVRKGTANFVDNF